MECRQADRQTDGFLALYRYTKAAATHCKAIAIVFRVRLETESERNCIGQMAGVGCLTPEGEQC